MGIHSYLMCSNMSLSINLTFIFLMCSKMSPSVNLTLINLMSLLQLSRSKYLLILTCDVHPLHASLNAHPPTPSTSPLTTLLTLTFLMSILQLSRSKYLLILTCDIHSLHALSLRFFTYVDICDVCPLHAPSSLLLNVR